MRFLVVFLSLLVPGFFVTAQDTAFLQQKVVPDSIAMQNGLQSATTAKKSVAIPSFDSCRNAVLSMLQINSSAPGEFFLQKEKLLVRKDWLFYYLLAIGLLFGVLRLTYSRYLNDLFRFFFRTSLRVNQIREQLVQSGLQSLLFNIFFAVSFGIYIYLLSSYFHASYKVEEWLVSFVATVSLLLLYLGKYLFLKASGWLFNIRTATETYTFIVFLINKVAGIAILPFLIVIAFSPLFIVHIAVTISVTMVIGLFLYRFLRAYQPVQAETKVSRFHFFIYLLAVEVAPLLLIYKLLIRFF